MVRPHADSMNPHPRHSGLDVRARAQLAAFWMTIRVWNQDADAGGIAVAAADSLKGQLRHDMALEDHDGIGTYYTPCYAANRAPMPSWC